VGRLWDAVWDALLPRACAHCRRDAAGPLCPPCARALPPPPEPGCARCAGTRGAAPLCRDCAGGTFACRLVRAAHSHRGPAAALVHAFKFRGCRDAAIDAGRRMALDFATRPELSGADAVTPVPLRPSRLRERGYNQAEELAREIAAAAALPLLDALERRRGARPSWRLGRLDRRRELAGAFAVRRGAESAVAGRRVLIVDDVASTGTTLEECARALREAGAADAVGYAFTRAGRE
jgi:predicted amidophosphoribosyltransferase